MRRLDFDTDPIPRPRRAAHALGRRLGLCRWWLLQYRLHPRKIRAQEVVVRLQRLLGPERDRLVALASLYDQRQPVQYALFDPVKVLTDLRPGARSKALAGWLLERAEVAARVSESISRNAEARWHATRDGDAILEMFSSGQHAEPWVQRALVELQTEELGDPDPVGRNRVARLLRRIERALVGGGRGRRRRGGRQPKRQHDPVTQARFRRKSKLINQIRRRQRQGEDLGTVATEILHDFVTGMDRILNEEQCKAVAREVRAALGL